MKLQSILFILFILHHSSFGQKIFQKRFGFNTRFYNAGLLKASDGGYVIGGSKYLADYKDIRLIKITEDGDTSWSRIYNHPLFNYWMDCTGVVNTPEGGYLLAAQSSIGIPRTEIVSYVLKTDSVGNLIWAKQYFGIYANYVIPTVDGNYVIAGYGLIPDSIYQNQCSALLKLNADGDTLWSKKFSDQAKDEWVYFLEPTADSGFIALIDKRVTNITFQYHLVKFDGNGVIQWSQSYGAYDFIESIRRTKDGNYLVAGSIDTLAAFMKLDANFNFVWGKTYDSGDRYTSGNDVVEINDGTLMLLSHTGIINMFAEDIGDTYFIKGDKDGNVLFSKAYGDDSFEEESYRGFNTTDGGYLISSRTSHDFNNGIADAFLVKTDGCGNSGCVERNINTTVANFTATADTNTYTSPAFFQDKSDGFIFPTDTSAGIDIITLCSDDFKCFTNVSPVKHDAFKISCNNRVLKIRGNQFKNAELTLYDITGRFILRKMIDEDSIDLNMDRFSAGAYLLTIVAKGIAETFATTIMIY